MSTLGSLRHRVLILDGEYYNSWKVEIAIFDESNLSKYVKCPDVSPIEPLHPTHGKEIDMLHNLRTVNLTIRGLRKNVLVHMQNFE